MPKKSLQKILYVEDDEDIRALVTAVLVSGGFILETCESGEEALAKLPKFLPDLILLDMILPGMDGPTTLQKIREDVLYQSIPVIFMTAKTDPHEIKNYHQMGAAGVIAKPFDPLTLVSEVQKVWNGWNKISNSVI